MCGCAVACYVVLISIVKYWRVSPYLKVLRALTRETARYREIRTTSETDREIPSDAENYREIPIDTERYQDLQRDTQRL